MVVVVVVVVVIWWWWWWSWGVLQRCCFIAVDGMTNRHLGYKKYNKIKYNDRLAETLNTTKKKQKKQKKNGKKRKKMEKNDIQYKRTEYKVT